MRTNRYTAPILALLGLVNTTPVLGQASEQAELEETIVTGRLLRTSATKSDTPIMETARSLVVVPEQLIIDRGALNLDDTYLYTAGVTGQPFGFATRGDFIFIRGLEVPQYQDSLQSLFGNYNNPRPDIYTIEQVEILKGPAGALYGKGSPGGLVNVISKRPQDQARREILAAYGNYDYRELAFDFTGPIDKEGKWLYRLVGVYRDSDTQVDNVDDNRRVIAPSLTWRPTNDTDLTLLLDYTKTEGDTAAQFLPIGGTLRPAPNGQYVDNSVYLGDTNFNRYDAESTSVTLLGYHTFNAIWSLEFNGRYTDAKADYRQAWPAFIDAFRIEKDGDPRYRDGQRYVYNEDGSLYQNGTVPRSWFGSDATSEQFATDIRLRANFNTGRVEHQMLMGAQYQDVTIDDDGYYLYALGYNPVDGSVIDDTYWINVFDPSNSVVPPQELLDSSYNDGPKTKSKDLGIYISDQLTIGGWNITLGLRFDDTTNEVENTERGKVTDRAFSGSAGLLYHFDNGIAPYISYADTFEPVLGNNGIEGQPLEPQEGWQVETGVKYQPTNFPALITLAVFDIRQTNLPDPSALPGQIEQQSGEAKIQGIELESQAHLGDFFWQFNYSRLRTESAERLPEDPSARFRLASVPDTQASTWLSYRPMGSWTGFKTGAGIRYVGASYGGYDEIKTPAYTLGDFLIGYELKHWDLTLNVNNITDKDYQATCLNRGDCFPGTRRTVVGRLRFIF